MEVMGALLGAGGAEGGEGVAMSRACGDWLGAASVQLLPERTSSRPNRPAPDCGQGTEGLALLLFETAGIGSRLRWVGPGVPGAAWNKQQHGARYATSARMPDWPAAAPSIPPNSVAGDVG